MVPTTVTLDDVPSSPDTESLTISAEIATPTTQSGATSPCLDEGDDVTVLSSQKRKKKKKPKKSAKAKEAAAAAVKEKTQEPEDGRPPVLCISRNKHWRYISSYHVCDLFDVSTYEAHLISGPMAATTYRTVRFITCAESRPCHTFCPRITSTTSHCPAHECICQQAAGPWISYTGGLLPAGLPSRHILQPPTATPVPNTEAREGDTATYRPGRFPFSHIYSKTHRRGGGALCACFVWAVCS